MSKRRGKQHLKNRAPSARKIARPVAPRIEERPEQTDFYKLALTVEKDEQGVLRQVAPEVTGLTQELSSLGYRMGWITGNDPNCLGIAAPQMGVSVRIISVRDKDRVVHVVVNPEIRRTVSAVKMAEFEGCFSLPDQRVMVERWSAVVLTGTDLRGKPVRLTLAGISARCAQHEIDHLDGVLISDHGEMQPVKGEVIATGEKLGAV